jgi:hypothetical protein
MCGGVNQVAGERLTSPSDVIAATTVAISVVHKTRRERVENQINEFRYEQWGPQHGRDV